jgi:hypothetical protein
MSDMEVWAKLALGEHRGRAVCCCPQVGQQAVDPQVKPVVVHAAALPAAGVHVAENQENADGMQGVNEGKNDLEVDQPPVDQPAGGAQAVQVVVPLVGGPVAAANLNGMQVNEGDVDHDSEPSVHEGHAESALHNRSNAWLFLILLLI